MAAIEELGAALADAVEAALPGWAERCVHDRLPPAAPDRAGVLDAARAAGQRAAAEVGAAVRDLLAADIDDQRGNPLALLRGAVRYPTEVLRRAGVPAVARDDFSAQRFPADDYDLTPANFADVDPSLSEPGIAWGAAKAWAHKQRHGHAAPPAP